MYENFRKELLTQLQPSFTTEQLTLIQNALDICSYKYDIKEKETSLIVYEDANIKLLKTYISCMIIEGQSEKTLKGRYYILKNFIDTVNKDFKDVERNDVRFWLLQYKKSTNVSDSSLDKYRQYICTFFKWLHVEGYINYNPSENIKRIKFATSQKEGLTQLELEYVRDCCKTLRDKAMIEVLYSSGVRVDEFVNIKISDIDFNEKQFQVLGKGKKYRMCYLNDKAIYWILKYMKEERCGDSDYLFVGKRKPYNKLSTACIEKCIRNLNSKLSHDKNIKYFSPHSLRRTMATQALQHGMPINDVQKLLGHENINTTLLYAKTLQNDVKIEHSKCII